MNPKVNFYFNKGKWQDEFASLRKLALDSGLTEELKWGHPCYSLEGNNIFLMHGFKEYVALLFFKGALMRDPENILVQQTKNVQAARQMRFTHVDEIEKLESVVRSYIKQAIQVEKSGVKFELKKTKEFSMPDEFKLALSERPKLKKAFEALTPGRQRGYLLHFGSAKQVKTREARIEKNIPRILAGKGLED